MQDEVVARLASQLGPQLITAEVATREAYRPLISDPYDQAGLACQGNDPRISLTGERLFRTRLDARPGHIEALRGRPMCMRRRLALYPTDSMIGHSWRQRRRSFDQGACPWLPSRPSARPAILGLRPRPDQAGGQGIADTTGVGATEIWPQSHALIGMARLLSVTAGKPRHMIQDGATPQPSRYIRRSAHGAAGSASFHRQQMTRRQYGFKSRLEMNRNHPLAHLLLCRAGSSQPAR